MTNKAHYQPNIWEKPTWKINLNFIEIEARVRSLNNEISDFSVSTSNGQKARQVKMWKKTEVFFEESQSDFVWAENYSATINKGIGKKRLHWV